MQLRRLLGRAARAPHARPAAAALALALVGCGDGAGAIPLAGPRDGGAVLPAATVTYHADVAPVLARHCVGCHREGGVAPFALERYEDAAPAAEAIAHVTAERTMPPYLADASGACGDFESPRWLDDDTIDLLATWAAEGAPEGPPRSRPVPPPERETLVGEVVSIAPRAGYVPRADIDDDYRCFLADLAVDGDVDAPVYLTGWDVHPGTPASVHHVIVYAPIDDDAAAEARALDAAQDEAEGYTCFGAAVVAATPVALWAPGGGATRLPASTGIRLDRARPLIIQVHYNTAAARGEVDLTTVDLSIARTGVTPGLMLPLADLDMSLPPRQAEVRTSTTQRIADYVGLLDLIDLPLLVRLHAVYPHMHTLGRSLRVSLRRAEGDRDECVLDVPRWDFGWQLLYPYRSPVIFGARDAVTLECTYDTRSRSDTTTWGEGTADEMCLAFLFATLDVRL